jgi:ABC-2 type transport system ATP-binding protein
LWERRNEQVKLFSGGMKRRLEIARGLLHTPKILFLDEPPLGLDPQTRNQLWTQVKQLNQTEGVTIFLTTHYMDEAERVAQRIAIIAARSWPKIRRKS